MMTQKDYGAIAKVFADARKSAARTKKPLAPVWWLLRNDIAGVMLKDNAQFDPDGFFAATEAMGLS